MTEFQPPEIDEIEDLNPAWAEECDPFDKDLDVDQHIGPVHPNVINPTGEMDT